MIAIQDCYPSRFAHCYGRGPANPNSLKLKSYLVDDRTEARFTPDSRYTGGVPETLYGGMIASRLDCHGTASAVSFAYRDRGRQMGDGDGLPHVGPGGSIRLPRRPRSRPGGRLLRR